MTTFLSLGSNIHPRHHFIEQACALIEERVGHIEARSHDFYSAPWGYQSQHEYLNIALKVQTSLTPLTLLDTTEQIERDLGRVQKNHYSDRTIDIDLIFCFDDNGNALVLSSQRLTLPHPHWQERDFVRVPINEISQKEYMIRRAKTNDIKQIMSLLHQVNMVHYSLRPDLFRPNTTKYDEQQLTKILADDDQPVFVYDDGEVRGYAFCQIHQVKDDLLLHDSKELYIDDLCVDEQQRGKHIGKALFDHVLCYAKQAGCHNLTLNVWAGNDVAIAFYRQQGMKVQKTKMEMILG